MKAFLGFLILLSVGTSWSADVLMVTMGGTKSHKIPFMELARGLIARGHNITFLSGFPADFSINGLHEITPAGLVDYIQNYTNWDLVGARMAGEMPIPLWDAIRYTFQSCDSMLEDAETKELLNRSFDLAILDGAFPECALGLVYKFKCPFMYINTVGFYMGSISLTGNPATFSITPAVFSTFTDNMNLIQRAMNTVLSISMNLIHVFVATCVHTVLKKHFGSDIPHVYDMSRNVSVILQNSHATVSYPRPFLPNIVEIACIHCRPPGPLPKDLENFVNSSGESGFIYVSMGSSVKAVNMPEHLRKLLVQTFARLPYHVLWKWEGSNSGMHDLTPNVKLNRWLPQQDILGHKKLRAFITHGGLLSMLETIYHGVPIVTMPVFCDHDVNAAKGEVDGYAIKLNLETLSSDKLYKAIIKVIHDTRYRNAAKIRQRLLLDQRTSPLDTAVYWTEYVIRHKGAYHLQTPARNMSWIEYYLVDVFALYMLIIMSIVYIIKKLLKYEILRILKKKQKLQ